MNKKSNLTSILVALSILGLAILACGPVVKPSTPSQPTPGANVPSNPATTNSELIAATVQIFGVHIQGGDIEPFYVGSGSIISSNGLILTNAHVADPASRGDPEMSPDALIIGIVQAEDRPPVYSYRAEVKAIDGYVDLAVIQITSTMDGARLDPSSLNLPYVALGDSDQVHVGDPIHIYGFPAIGGNTITFTSGNAAGFISEDQIGDRAWIKTDATISGGNSGGMSTNEQGLLIGVPTIASSGANTEATDCRVIQDTNGDGSIDNNDTCIPIGGFINALRPVNLALPLIRAAQGGLAYTSPYSTQSQGGYSQATGREQIDQVGWFEVDQNGNLGDQVTSYPHGSTVLVAAFSFSGFVNGEPWGEIWTSGGQEIYSGTYAWDQGTEGTYGTTISAQGDPLPDGTYHLALFGGDNPDPLAESEIVVGDDQSDYQGIPSQGDIQIYGIVSDKNTGRPIDGALVLALVPGITFDDWAAADYPMEQVYTYTQTDSHGRYSLPAKLTRNTAYTLVAAAEGYYDSYGDNLEWNDQDPSDYEMNISLSK